MITANADWDFPYVDDDGRRGIALVVKHLLARGHRRIAMMSRPVPAPVPRRVPAHRPAAG